MDLIHGGPPALPGACFKCSSGTRKRYLDWGAQWDFHGALYLCDECVIEMARLLGMGTEEQFTKLNFDLLTSREKINQLQGEIDALKKSFNGLDELNEYFAPAPASNSSLSVGSVDEGEELPDSTSGSSSGQEGLTEPLDDEGVDELRTTESSDKFEFGGF